MADHLAASGHPYQIRTWARSRLRAGRWAAASSLLTYLRTRTCTPGDRVAMTGTFTGWQCRTCPLESCRDRFAQFIIFSGSSG